MHTYVHNGAVYNSKDLEPNQMPIDGRLDKENVAHIHHGILCSHKKWWVHVICRDMDESGNQHSQQTDTRTASQHHMLSLIGRCWTMRTHGHREGSITQCGLLWGTRERTAGIGSWGDNMGRNARYKWWGDEGSKPHCRVCTYATILHDLHMYPTT